MKNTIEFCQCGWPCELLSRNEANAPFCGYKKTPLADVSACELKKWIVHNNFQYRRFKDGSTLTSILVSGQWFERQDKGSWYPVDARPVYPPVE